MQDKQETGEGPSTSQLFLKPGMASGRERKGGVVSLSSKPEGRSKVRIMLQSRWTLAVTGVYGCAHGPPRRQHRPHPPSRYNSKNARKRNSSPTLLKSTWLVGVGPVLGKWKLEASITQTQHRGHGSSQTSAFQTQTF